MRFRGQAIWFAVAAAAFLAAVSFAPGAGRADDISNWSNIDNNNNRAPPLGWPAGMLPSQVEPTARAMMGAIKRFHDAVGVSVQEFGAACDHTTDDTAAINAAFAQSAATGSVIRFPAAPCRSAAGVTMPAGASAEFPAFLPTNPPASIGIQCDNGVAVCLTIIGDNTSLGSASLMNASIFSSGTPTSGSVGVRIQGGYAISAVNLNIFDFDTCAYWGPGSTSAGGIRTEIWNLREGKCASHWNVVDGWPEITVVGGTAGANGAEYSSSQDFLYQTESANVGAGGGPNTVTFDDFHFVVPGMGSSGCPFRWGGWAGTGGVRAETRLTNFHVELHTPIDALFCSDATVPLLQQLYVTNMLSSTSYGGSNNGHVFDFNPATALKSVNFVGDTFDSCISALPLGITLAPMPSSGPGLQDVHFAAVSSCGGASFTSNSVAGSTLMLTGNTWGSLRIAGNWTDLESHGDQFASLVDTASGNVAIGNAQPQSWTPTLEFCTGSVPPCSGESVGFSTLGGTVTRTAEGGFIATVNMVTASAPVSPTGAAAQFVGLPYVCANGTNSLAAPSAGGAVSHSFGFAMGTALPLTDWINPNFPGQQALVLDKGGGEGPLLDTDFGSNSFIFLTLTCAKAS